jgi:hypothetical protein
MGTMDGNDIDVLRGKLEDAKIQYSADPNAETCAEFRRLQCLFKHMVLRDQLSFLE